MGDGAGYPAGHTVNEPVVPTMPTDDPAAVLHALFDALNAHDTDRAARHLAPSYHGLDATRSATTEGRDAARAEIQTGLDAFAPTFSIRQCVADPPHVAVFWRMAAVHEGSFLQIPPTHQSMSVSGTGLFTVRDEQITRGVHLWDLAGLLRAVNLLPDLPSTDAGPTSSIFDRE
jgi:predicted ester cyclase